MTLKRALALTLIPFEYIYIYQVLFHKQREQTSKPLKGVSCIYLSLLFITIPRDPALTDIFKRLFIYH